MMQLDDKEDDGQSGATGGAGGKIEFRYQDLYSSPATDNLPLAEKEQHLLMIHEGRQGEHAKDAKQKMAAMVERKNADKPVKAHSASAGMGAGSASYGSESKFASHPTLSKSAQYAGMPSQVNPADANAEKANAGQKQSLENQHRLTHSNRPTNTPTLRRT